MKDCRKTHRPSCSRCPGCCWKSVEHPTKRRRRVTHPVPPATFLRALFVDCFSRLLSPHGPRDATKAVQSRLLMTLRINQFTFTLFLQKPQSFKPYCPGAGPRLLLAALPQLYDCLGAQSILLSFLSRLRV